MLLIAAALTVLLCLVHSILGEQNLLQPLLAMEGLPVIRGDVEVTKGVIRATWHGISITWSALAAMMVYVHFHADPANRAFLWMVAVLFLLSGIVSFVAGGGAHLSWVAFLIIAALTALAALHHAV